MNYSFRYRNTALDYMLFKLGNAYHQWTAIVNIIFVAGFAILIYFRWNDTNLLGRILMIFGLLIFPVFQPLAMFLTSLGTAAQIQVDTTLTFRDRDMQILVKGHDQSIPYEKMYPLVKRRTHIVVVPDAAHAFILPIRVMGEQREAFYRDVEARIDALSTHAAG